jgi:hypothetical protein
MGSILTVEIFSFDIYITLPGNDSPQFNPFILLLIPLFLIFGIIAFFLIRSIFRRFSKPKRNTWIPPQTFFAIIAFLLLIQCASAGKGGNKYKRIGKATAKSTVPAFTTVALYFGLEKLAEYLQNNPESATAILSFIGCGFVIVILLVIKTLIRIYFLCRPHQSVNSPHNPESIELGNIRRPQLNAPQPH